MDKFTYDINASFPSNRVRLGSDSSDCSVGTDVSATSSLSHRSDVLLSDIPEQPTRELLPDTPEYSKATVSTAQQPRSSFPQLIKDHDFITNKTNNSSEITKTSKIRRSRKTHRRSQFCFVG
mmetsp:Transcript_17095/g.19039  ORF Transcript_17095/g.19039 Transcript_17095/m.19039 type:complete len:122 (-) Transcript_17095:208-573(-)